MASNDPTNPVQLSEKDVQLEANRTTLDHDKPPAHAADGASDAGKATPGRSRDPSPASQSSVSGLSSAKGGTQSPGPPPLSMPHPKKFSHVNISKKFLEKTSSASTPAHNTSASPVLKATNINQKPATQFTTSHPRLVTAKLTATPQPSSAGGWSRPSSAVPSAAPTPISAANAKTSSVPATTSSAAPSLGKLIQPQPRNGQEGFSANKDNSGKPVWGNAKSSATAPERVHVDFPTAAEVAQGRIMKAAEQSTSDAATAHKDAVIADLAADEATFRGAHLDPNAHHWDEMEEDDDNFLGGVIEFGDGRQYQVQSSDAPRQSSPPREPRALAPGSQDKPVSKEERFQDDFDRSWPRSRSGPHQAPGYPRDQSSGGAVTSPSASASASSPQESSKVLFNERSNRLEPYSHQRPGAPTPFNRRSSRSDYSTSPTEPRRDAPPHTHLQGVQLLQKGPNAPHPDSPTFSRAPGDRSPLSAESSRFRERQQTRRDHTPWQANGAPGTDHGRSGIPPHPSGRSPRDGHFGEHTQRAPFESSHGSGGDSRRQLPPHLSTPGTRHVPPIRTDGDIPPRSPVHPPSASGRSEPPAPSASSQVAESPAAPSSALPAPDLEEARKAAMHTAAERARLRRQQEEEEREREKERARKKAAEIEARMKAAEEAKAREREKTQAQEQHTETQVLGIIEEAVSSVVLSSKRTESVDVVHDDASPHAASARPQFGRAPSSRGTARPFAPRRTSFTTPSTTNLPATSDTDTWRRKNHQDHPPPSVLSAAAAFAHADLDVKEGEDVDVVDFADFGKLVGSEPPAEPASATHPSTSRPVASDFFQDEAASHRPSPIPSKADEGPWRRRSSVTRSHAPPDKLPSPAEEVQAMVTTGPVVETHDPTGHATFAASPPAHSHEDHHRRLSGQFANGPHKPLTGPHYREAPMSALDDAIARIRGAIDGMHHDGEPPKEPAKVEKWLPPALRAKSAPQPTEVFDVTGIEPPRSPKPAWNVFAVKLAHDVRPPRPRFDFVWPRGHRFLKLEVYSWDPPDALARPNSSFNEYLYGRPRMIKGQPKYFVSLPRTRPRRRLQEQGVPPVVNLPVTPPRLRNTNPNSKEAIASSWRKAPVSPTTSLRPLQDAVPELGLDTVSRSPPPEAPSTQTSAPVPSQTAAALAQTKPADADVAFYRTGRAEPRASMQFIVSSELESEPKLGLMTAEMKPIATAPGSSIVASSPIKVTSTEAKAHEPTNGAFTAPMQPPLSQWSKSPKALTVKESPARAPDPEHLKAVWSQTSDKAEIQPVNSLKDIADDLTGVPFSLQDVKSVDGATPPPSGTGPWTRMSAYEVTRAFQQVPSPSSSSLQRPAPSAPAPPSTNGSAPRNPTFTFSPPPMGQLNMRPAYGYSPMMSAPPQPVMYSHTSPVPRPMVVNGSNPAYGQPMWMPGPPPPQSGGLLRSPYPAQLVPYPSPGAVPMYASPMPGMQNPLPQPNGAQGRPGMPMVSPVMQPAMPHMYGGSPILVHAPPAMPQGQSYPVPGQPNRGPMRPYDQNPGTPHMHQQMRPPQHPPQHPPQQNGYNPIPSGYARPPW